MPEPSTRWLVQVERGWLHLWVERMAPWRPTLTDALGEATWRVHFAEPVSASEVAESVFCQYAIPVRHILSGVAPDAEDIGRVCSGLLRSAQVFATRPRRAEEAAELATRLTHAGWWVGPVNDLDAPQLLMAVSERATDVGVASAREAGWLVGGASDARAWLAAGHPISRAGLKWRESRRWLTLLGLEPPAGRWLELGASPGGITSELACEPGCEGLVAVDRAPLHPSVASLPGVEVVQADATTVRPEGTFVGLVCDLNCPPATALDAVIRLRTSLVPGALLVHTLKLPSREGVSNAIDRARCALQSGGYRVVGLRHLISHRQEIVVVGKACG